jgi:hypothetical protein
MQYIQYVKVNFKQITDFLLDKKLLQRKDKEVNILS